MNEFKSPKYGLYAMKDRKATFCAPTVELSDETAIRNFKFTMSRSDSIYAFSPEDFCLVKLGYFDVDTGHIELIPQEVIA